MFLMIGAKRRKVASLKDASEKFVQHRERTGFGSSGMPLTYVTDDDGKRVARVSYNGRVWPLGEWSAVAQPLYDNR